jgi:fatty acid desaturase
MEENTKLIESLIERAAEYGKTSIELVKLNAVDKTSDMVSSFIPHTVVFVFIASFMIFFNLGLAFWIGEILGTVYFGFFVVASFYIVSGMVVHFFLHKRFKKYIYNAIIKQLLN